VATPWQADRSDRVQRFSWPRRLLDSSLNAPVLRRLERQVLRAPRGRILALSRYTARALEAIAGRPITGVLLMPVDTTIYRPAPQRLVPWRIGFSGRYGDPRKHIDLLLAALRLLVDQGHPVQLELVGEPNTCLLGPRLEALGLVERVHCHPFLQPPELAAVLQGLDLFVIPSHQEGLCIAALEAMACAVPVVSTRCGGPEEFVVAGSTGQLVDSDPAAMAGAIAAICGDRDRRRRLGAGAADWVAAHASPAAARSIFRRQVLELDCRAAP
jgi:glycosyltransferase involved in cell wall biosynthesis